MFIILEMSLFCILSLMHRLTLQASSLKSSSWIACTASLMVYLALYIVSRHSYWSLILRSWPAKQVVCKLTFVWVNETPDPSKLSTIAFTADKFFAQYKAVFNQLPHLVRTGWGGQPIVANSAVARVSEAPPEISRGAPHTLLAYYYELQ